MQFPTSLIIIEGIVIYADKICSYVKSFLQNFNTDIASGKKQCKTR